MIAHPKNPVTPPENTSGEARLCQVDSKSSARRLINSVRRPNSSAHRANKSINRANNSVRRAKSSIDGAKRSVRRPQNSVRRAKRSVRRANNSARRANKSEGLSAIEWIFRTMKTPQRLPKSHAPLSESHPYAVHLGAPPRLLASDMSPKERKSHP